MIKDLNDFILRLQAASSRIEKEKILKTATPEQKAVLEFICNPYKVTGIGKKKLESRVPTQKVNDSLEQMLEYLLENHTGSDADVDYVLNIAYSTEYPELVKAIARKDVTLGLSADTLNKVFGKDFIPTFKVQLAQSYTPDRHLQNGESFTITEKLDGVRCILMFENGRPHFYTRSGREIENLVDLKKEAVSLRLYDYVFDGELLINKDGESNTLYRETMSVVGSEGIKREIIFRIFDCLPLEDFKKGRCDVEYSDRRKLLESLDLHLRWIRVLPALYRGTDTGEVPKLLSEITGKKGEGVMININSAPYICDRHAGLLKVKSFKECEAVVRSIEIGTGRNENRLGAVMVDIKDKNGKCHSVRVGSGFTDAMRDYYFSNQDVLIGKVIEVGYFEVTKNKADDTLSLRFPTWLDRIRIDKAEKDMTPVCE